MTTAISDKCLVHPMCYLASDVSIRHMQFSSPNSRAEIKGKYKSLSKHTSSIIMQNMLNFYLKEMKESPHDTNPNLSHFSFKLPPLKKDSFVLNLWMRLGFTKVKD